MSTTPDENGGSIETPSNVLLLASSVGSGAETACNELLETAGSDPKHTVLVSCLRSPAERLAATEPASNRSSRTTVVDVGMASRSATSATGGGESPADVRVERVPDSADLIDLGERLDGHLADGDEETTLCLDSVTDLMQTADSQAVFKFLEVLTSSVDRANAVAHYHMNPDVHDPETVATFEVLFDAVVDLRADGVDPD